jgi:hypothetical protein
MSSGAPSLPLPDPASGYHRSPGGTSCTKRSTKPRPTGELETLHPLPPYHPLPRPSRGSYGLTVQPHLAHICDAAPCCSASRTRAHCPLPPRRVPSRNRRSTAAHTARTPPATHQQAAHQQAPRNPESRRRLLGTPPASTDTQSRVSPLLNPPEQPGAAATAPNPAPQGATPDALGGTQPATRHQAPRRPPSASHPFGLRGALDCHPQSPHQIRRNRASPDSAAPSRTPCSLQWGL